MPKLICRRVLFHSLADEWAFFQFAQHIPAVQKLEGKGDAIMIYVRSKPSERDLLDLIGLFSRYRIDDASQLARFLTPTNENWFSPILKKIGKSRFLVRPRRVTAPERVPTGSSRTSAPP